MNHNNDDLIHNTYQLRHFIETETFALTTAESTFLQQHLYAYLAESPISLHTATQVLKDTWIKNTDNTELFLRDPTVYKLVQSIQSRNRNEIVPALKTYLEHNIKLFHNGKITLLSIVQAETHPEYNHIASLSGHTLSHKDDAKNRSLAFQIFQLYVNSQPKSMAHLLTIQKNNAVRPKIVGIIPKIEIASQECQELAELPTHYNSFAKQHKKFTDKNENTNRKIPHL